MGSEMCIRDRRYTESSQQELAPSADYDVAGFGVDFAPRYFRTYETRVARHGVNSTRGYSTGLLGSWASTFDSSAAMRHDCDGPSSFTGWPRSYTEGTRVPARYDQCTDARDQSANEVGSLAIHCTCKLSRT